MYTYRERIIKFNGIQLSKTGFKDLKFETSRYSDSLNTIRGFGAQMNESNLSVVDTISVDFILKTDELADLAYIYCMFKAIGVLPIENEYLINKVSDTLSGGNETKYKFTHLLCFLERLQITSLEKTSNGYDVNMILTLYQNSFVGDQYKEFSDAFIKWNQDTKFSDICNKYTKEYSNNLGITDNSNLIVNIYNVEKLNAYYKENILDYEKFNKLLNGDPEIEAEIEANSKINYIKTKLPDKDKYIPASVKIDNKHILQIELITTNLISNFPMKGKPIGHKSFLGIGKSNFSVKMIFDESENDIVQQLKVISDKNILNHKFILNHPLVQLFDFYTSDITNITFNNLESANGIIVTMVFNISGFRYNIDEELLNSSDIILKKSKTDSYISESVCGLYLEHLSNYLMTNRYNNLVSISNINELLYTPLEGKIQNVNDDPSGQANVGYENEKYYFIDFLSSYSSVTTSFGYHKSNSDKISVFPIFENKDKYNSLVNKGQKVIDKLKKVKHNNTADIFSISHDIHNENLSISDEGKDYRNLFPFRDLVNSYTFYNYLDTVSIYMVTSSKKIKDEIYTLLYKDGYKTYSEYLMENVINQLGIELFNTKQGIDTQTFSIYSKIYEEFYYRLFDIELNMNPVPKYIEELIKDNTVLVVSDGICFSKIHQLITDIVSCFLDKFVDTLKDEEFLDRIIEEVYLLVRSTNKDYKESQVQLYRESFRDMLNQLFYEVSYQSSNKRQEIIDKIYNIFLTKLNYYLVMYIYGGKYSVEYERLRLSMNTQIKVLLLSSCSFAPLFLYSKNRTDHFGKAMTIGAQNIGIKITEFNKHLLGFTGENKILNNNALYYMFKQNNTEEKDEEIKDIYQLFTTLFGKKINHSYYFDVIKNSTILGNKDKYLTYDEVIKKDCLYFYGSKIPRYDLHIELSKIINPKDDKEACSTINDFLSKAKEQFISGEKYCEVLPNEMVALGKTGYAIEDYGFNSLNKIQRFHYSDVPSYYKQLFLDNSGEETKINDVMKTRIIGHNDMFYNLDNITKVITDSSNSIIPDYVISIVKKNISSEYAGEINTYITEEYELFANNISNISITKDPKTKIKTATIEIINIKKHVFSIGEDGSFNVKEMNNGKIDVIRIEPGDEIRIKLGYILNNNVFNGAISNIQFGDNIMVLTCTSFGALMYSYNIPKIAFTNSDSILGKSIKILKGIPKIIDSSFISSANISSLYELGNVFNNFLHSNRHLFNIFKTEYNNVHNFLKGNARESGMFVAVSITLRHLPRRILDKIDGKLSNITSNKLLNSKIVLSDIDKTFGAQEQTDELTTDTITGNTFKNINNIDHDYETYGINNSGESFELSETGEIKISQKQVEDAQSYLSKLSQPKFTAYDQTVNKDLDPIIKLEDGDTWLTNWPCAVKRITALKGEPRDGGKREHNGLDIADYGKEGAIVYAAGKGIVDKIYNSTKGATGRYVVIKHEIHSNDGKTKKYIYSWYMHLKKIGVSKGTVNAGEPIGVLGGSGFGLEKDSSGKKGYIPHLHFELRDESGNRINPLAKGVLPKFNLIFKPNLKGYPGQYVEEIKAGRG